MAFVEFLSYLENILLQNVLQKKEVYNLTFQRQWQLFCSEGSDAELRIFLFTSEFSREGARAA